MMSGLHAALSALAVVLGVFVAVHHPLWPALLPQVFLVWCLVVCARPIIWLYFLPALLPVAGFSVWTGWIGVEEFDLLVLGAVAGCHARMVMQRCRREPGPAEVPAIEAAMPRWHAPSRSGQFAAAAPPGEPAIPGRFRSTEIWLGLLTVSYLFALLRGLADAGDLRLGWFQAYEEPLNSLRIAKSFLLLQLLSPSLRSLLRREPERAGRYLASGVATGLGLAGLAIVAERAAYPGLLDFSTPYRSTALFWEMHVGGAALDGFLALAIPFAVHAVLRARSPWRWALAASLAVLAAYACLTTFSRAVYLGVGFSLIVLACLLAPPRSRRQRLAEGAAPIPSPAAPELWRMYANRGLVVVLALEAFAVVGLGDFMGARLAAGERDLGGRMQHWREGLSLLGDPSEFLLGRGLGRFPANYSQTVPGREMPGRLRIIDEGQGSYLRFFAAGDKLRSRGTFQLVQRLPELVEGRYAVNLELRAAQPARLSVGLCHRHLLYAASCSQRLLVVPHGDDEWRHFSMSLNVQGETAGWWRLPAPGFFELRLYGPADFVDIDKLNLVDAKGRQLLSNGDFSSGMSHWFFSGHHYFLPWHVDNLFLEILIEQGVVGLLLLLALLTMAFANLLGGPGKGQILAPYLLAALLACLGVGVFVSLLDMPRSAFLFYLLLCSALFLGERPSE